MIRDDLLDKLARYRPTAEEVENHARMIAFVRGHTACFERVHWSGHVTAAAWLVDDRAPDRLGPGRVLLTHHRKLDKWLQLGGHCDGDGDVVRVALKEAREESGISGIEVVSTEIFDLDVHAIPARGGEALAGVSGYALAGASSWCAPEPAHFHFDVRFLCRVTGDARFTVSEESHELRWVSGREIEGMEVGRSIRRMYQKWASLNGWR